MSSDEDEEVEYRELDNDRSNDEDEVANQRMNDAAERKLASRKKSEKFYRCTVTGCNSKSKDKFPGKSFKKHIEQRHQLNWQTFVKVLWDDGLRQPQLGETMKGADMLDPHLKRIRGISETKKQPKRRKVDHAPLYHQLEQEEPAQTPYSYFDDIETSLDSLVIRSGNTGDGQSSSAGHQSSSLNSRPSLDTPISTTGPLNNTLSRALQGGDVITMGKRTSSTINTPSVTQLTTPVKQPTGTIQLPNPKAHNIPGAILKLEAALDRTKLPNERDKLIRSALNDLKVISGTQTMAAVPAPPAPPAQRNLPALSPNYMVDQVEACKSSTDLLKLSWIRDWMDDSQSPPRHMARCIPCDSIGWAVPPNDFVWNDKTKKQNQHPAFTKFKSRCKEHCLAKEPIGKWHHHLDHTNNVKKWNSAILKRKKVDKDGLLAEKTAACTLPAHPVLKCQLSHVDLELNRSDIKTYEEPVKVKEEACEDVAMESLEKQIEDLLHYANKHNDQNAALKILKLESLIIERDSIKWEQMDALSNCEMSKSFKEATGQSVNNNYLQDEARL